MGKLARDVLLLDSVVVRLLLLRHGDSLPLRSQGAEGIILPGGFSDKSSICPECLVSMVTEACIVCFSALSSAVCFLDRPLTGFKAF